MHQDCVLFKLFPSCLQFLYITSHFLHANWRIVICTLNKNCLSYETLCFFSTNVNFGMIDLHTLVHLISTNSEKMSHLFSKRRVVHLFPPIDPATGCI